MARKKQTSEGGYLVACPNCGCQCSVPSSVAMTGEDNFECPDCGGEIQIAFYGQCPSCSNMVGTNWVKLSNNSSYTGFKNLFTSVHNAIVGKCPACSKRIGFCFDCIGTFTFPRKECPFTGNKLDFVDTSK